MVTIYTRQGCHLCQRAELIVAAARKNGISEEVIESAQKSPAWKYIMEWKLALPLQDAGVTILEGVCFYILQNLTQMRVANGWTNMISNSAKIVPSKSVEINLMAGLIILARKHT